MNSLNKTSEPNQNPHDNNKQKALKSEIIQSFKNFFKKAEKTTTEKVDPAQKKMDTNLLGRRRRPGTSVRLSSPEGWESSQLSGSSAVWLVI